MLIEGAWLVDLFRPQSRADFLGGGGSMLRVGRGGGIGVREGCGGTGEGFEGAGSICNGSSCTVATLVTGLGCPEILLGPGGGVVPSCLVKFGDDELLLSNGRRVFFAP